MKKFTLLLSALVVALTINAVPATSVKNLAQKAPQQTAAFQAPANLSAVLQNAPKSNLKKATALDDINLQWEQVNLLYGAHFTWQDDNPETAIVFLYLIDGNTFEYIASGGWYAYAFVDDSIDGVAQYAAESFILLQYGEAGDAFDANTFQLYGIDCLLPDGVYIFNAIGTNSSQSAKTFDDYVFFTIKSNEVTDIKAVVNDEKTKATITWDESSLPEDNYAVVYVYTDSTLVFTNDDICDYVYDEEGKQSVECSQDLFLIDGAEIEIDVEDGKSYEVDIRVYTDESFVFNGSGFPNGMWASEVFTAGTNAYAPTDLQATVAVDDSLHVDFAWTLSTAKEDAGYILSIYEDEYETLVENFLIDEGDKNAFEYDGEEIGTYYWSVQGLILVKDGDGNLTDYWTLTEEVKGGSFKLTDNVAPEISAVEAKVTNTTVVLTPEVNDNYSYEEDLLFILKNGEDVLLDKVALDELKVADLTAGTEYTWSLIVIDEAGNESAPFAVVFTTTNDTEAPVLASAVLVEAFDKYANIEVSATDNITPAEEIRYKVVFEDASEAILEATEGIITLEGLIPETAYKVTVKALDNENLESEGIEVEFTTTAIIPITLAPTAALATLLGQPAEDVYAWQINVYGPKANSYLPDIYLTILNDKTDKISGSYSSAEMILQKPLSHLEVSSPLDTIIVTDATLDLEFVGFTIDGGIKHGNYNVRFQIQDDNYNIFQGTISNLLVKANDGQKYISMIHEDVVAPWTDGIEVVDITTNSAEVIVYAGDGDDADAQRASYGNLVVKLYNADDDSELGTLEASGTATDLDYHIILENLEPNTTYNVYAIVTDEADNVSEKESKSFQTLADIKYFKITLVAENGTISVVEEGIDLDAVAENTVLHFTATPAEGYEFSEWKGYDEATGLTVTADATVEAVFVEIKDALDNISADGKAYKVIRDGQIYIIRDNKQFNVLGAEVK